jgi:2-keto-4-pentenoate hydratase/2-oxohepta-3-ene-1,7-dioic acid hydratase in catechol pathway
LRIATYRLKSGGDRQVGQVSADGTTVMPFQLTPAEAKYGAQSLIERSVAGTALPRTGKAVALSDVTLDAPIPIPRRNLFCVGRNYHSHAKELASSVFKDSPKDVAGWPIVFSKVPETVIGPYDNVRMPGADISTQIDYEVELTIVIGKGGRNISRAEAMGHVYGYTIINDVTARDVQLRHQQWDLGKSFDTFCPMGPWIVTADELDGANTRVRCWVNEELRQDAQTTDLIFDIPSLVETCSRGITLYPGDLIPTGTTSGVGMGMTPQRWLKAGDVVRMEIDGLGRIENKFVD